MNFVAEIKQTKQRKAASLDNIYQIVLETNNPNILDLGKLSADSLFEVNIELVTEKPKELNLDDGGSH